METTFILESTILEVETELALAKSVHDKEFNSTHEGYAVLKEEVDELWHEVKHGFKESRQAFTNLPHVPTDKIHKEHKRRMREEAIQVAAMAVRFIQELTD